MATPKTWTATDVKQDRLSIIHLGLGLQLERRYKFVDGQGQVLVQVAGGRLTETVAISESPQNILDALQIIDNWTYLRILMKEGME